MSSFFIKHPIIAGVISIVMTLLGIISALQLPIAQYPEISPPMINLSATYPGADAQVVADSVATPIELQLAGVQGMDYMTSVNSNNGVCSLNVVFEVGSDPNMDQVLAYMRYAQATSQLPSEVSQMGVTIKQSSGLPLILYALYSPENDYDSVYLANYAYVSLVNAVKQVKGVGDVMVFGAGRYAIRIWLDTARLAKLGLSVSEVKTAIQVQNTVNPGGQIGAEPAPPGTDFTYTIRNKGRLTTVEEFEDIILRADGQKFVRLKDVAKVELGAQNYSLMGRYNGQPAGMMAIYQSAGSNAIETADALKALFAEYERNYPKGLVGSVALDTTTAVRDSIHEIFVTIFEALALVVIVVFLFLQGWRASLIPAIAVPVSIISTFCFFPMLGFTLNTICLLGMVLAIGLVVDDAIVVVEAVESHMERGMNARQASFAAMKEVSGPVVAIALVLAAVFLPSLLLPGITGTLFQQFAVTIAISMLISAFNALTLSPALCALLLKPKKESKKSLLDGFYKKFNAVYDKTAGGYARVCGFLSRKLCISLPLLLLISLLIIPAAEKTPNGFLPDEDQGFFLGALVLKDTSSMQRSLEQTKIAEKIIIANPAVSDVASVIGINILSNVQCTSGVTIFVALKPWEQREGHTAQQVLAQLSGALATSGLDAMPVMMNPPAIPGIGAAGGVTMILEDLEGRGVHYLAEQVNIFCEAAKKQPSVGSVTSMMMSGVKQPKVNLDYEKCYAQGVNVSEANQLFQTYLGSVFVNYVTLYGQQWQVYLQADGADRTSLSSLKNFYLKNSKGENIPLSALMTINEDNYDTEFVLHQNLHNAAQLMIMPAAGYSSAQVMEALEKTFSEVMPADMGYEYSGMSYQEKKVQGGLGLGAIFSLSALFAFLILAALYEKWALPLSIFLTVPIAVLGAFAGLLAWGIELNLYAQIGLVMLIGLAAKNAILIVEFAILQMERGQSLAEATISAAKLRLRPILMTSFAFILGCLPLMLAEGSGALARNAIGTVVVIGMLFATGVGVFLIPCSFTFIMKLFRIRIAKVDHAHDADEIVAMERLAAEEEKTVSEFSK